MLKTNFKTLAQPNQTLTANALHSLPCFLYLRTCDVPVSAIALSATGAGSAALSEAWALVFTSRPEGPGESSSQASRGQVTTGLHCSRPCPKWRVKGCRGSSSRASSSGLMQPTPHGMVVASNVSLRP